jgi:RNA polymerase sigma factor (TIGR02999 family)
LGEITALLGRAHDGDKSAEERLLDLVYGELKTIAARHMRRERANHTLRPTELVHEAFTKLAGGDIGNLQNRAHFYAVASTVMRRILVDYARARGSQKRGGDQPRVEAGEFLRGAAVDPATVLMVGEALDRLQQFDPRQCAIVEMRFFGGLTDDEIARVLGVSGRTVKRDWAIAKAWLYSQFT